MEEGSTAASGGLRLVVGLRPDGHPVVWRTEQLNSFQIAAGLVLDQAHLRRIIVVEIAFHDGFHLLLLVVRDLTSIEKMVQRTP